MTRWVRQCEARDGDTGRRCCLLDGHAGSHASPRGAFDALASPDQRVYARDLALESATAGRWWHPDGIGVARSEAQYAAWRRREARARARLAHRGVATTLPAGGGAR